MKRFNEWTDGAVEGRVVESGCRDRASTSRRAAEGPPHRRVRDRPRARRGRLRRHVPGVRPPVGRTGRAQGVLPRRGGETRARLARRPVDHREPSALHVGPRSFHRRGPVPPSPSTRERRAGASLRPGPRHRVHRHGVRRGRVPAAGPPGARPSGARRLAAMAGPIDRRAGSCTRPRLPAPRHQAREHHDSVGRRNPRADRFRRRAPGCPGANAHTGADARVRPAGAVLQRRWAGAADRHLRPGRGLVPRTDRNTAVECSGAGPGRRLRALGEPHRRRGSPVAGRHRPRIGVAAGGSAPDDPGMDCGDARSRHARTGR